jgi:hypothetical protein
LYNPFFIGRVDHKEREAMIEEDRMEFMWRGSDVLGNIRPHLNLEELDGPAVSVLRRAIAEVKQRWSVIGWVTENLLSLAPCFVRRGEPSLAPKFQGGLTSGRRPLVKIIAESLPQHDEKHVVATPLSVEKG